MIPIEPRLDTVSNTCRTPPSVPINKVFIGQEKVCPCGWVCVLCRVVWRAVWGRVLGGCTGGCEEGAGEGVVTSLINAGRSGAAHSITECLL
ncbi:unnamed protein product [Danaus chrysippus]|uniref:(African queen) hypothetical protein n=1 Tax=Danaus chrysippus TaxID=151541 RepID=A0A8J2W7M0_9NEOP|nr:unnamed protein product [Danaus chrysippus]